MDEVGALHQWLDVSPQATWRKTTMRSLKPRKWW